MAKQVPVNEAAPQESVTTKKKKSNETLFGSLLFFGMIVFFLACLGALGWGAYSFWHKSQIDKTEPSIVSLAPEPEEAAVASAPTSEAKTEEKSESAADTDL